MKKTIILFICIVLVCVNFPSKAMAYQLVSNDKSQNTNIDYLGTEDIQDVIEQDRILKELGFIEVPNNSISTYGPDDWTTDEIDGECDRAFWSELNGIKTRVCVVDKLYTKSKVENSTTEIRNLLKIGYNILLGNKTKLLWQISTILGLDAMFDINVGDSLVITEQQAYHYYYYKVYNNESEMWEIACSVLSIDEHVVANYSTLDASGKPVLLKDGERSEIYCSRYFYDTNWKADCAAQKQFGLVGSYDDKEIIA